MNALQEQLTAALRERAATVTLQRDLLGPAVRRARRRTAVRRGVSAAGTLGLAGAVAASALVATRPLTAVPTPSPVARGGDRQLDVAYVTARARAALSGLAADRDLVEHVRLRISLDGVAKPGVFWFDPRTGDSRFGTGDEDENGLEIRGAQTIATSVDHVHRTWMRGTYPTGETPRLALVDVTPADVRAALAGDPSEWTLVGREAIDGQATVHLRSENRESPGGPVVGSQDLWVDAAGYRPVRAVIVKGEPGHQARVVADFEWLPRTADTLAELRVRVPAGYRYAPPSAAAATAPPER